MGSASSGEWASEVRPEVLGPCLVPLREDSAVAGWAARIAADAFALDAAFRPFAGKFHNDLVLLGSDIVPVLLRECTEQAVRVQLSDAKTVANGPFYSEYLPAETIMVAALTLRGTGDTPGNRDALRGLLDGRLLRIGGDETLGKGLMWGRLLEAAS